MRACSSARCALVRSPGDSVDQGRPTWSAPSPNLASSVRASTAARPVAATKASRSGASPCSTRSCPIVPITVVRPSSLAPCSSGSSPRSIAEQRRLAAAVAPGHGEPLSRHEVEVDRAEREVAAPGDGAGEPGHGAARPGSRLELELELPRLERLLRQLVAVEQPLRLPHLRHQGMRAAAVGHAPSGTGLVAALVEQRRELLAALLRLLEPLVLAGAGGIARGGVLRPASRELAHAPAAVLDLGDARHRPVEERPVVRDDDEGGFGRRDEPLEALEPVEVEVVRRLVEQEHVVAREQDRRQGEPRGLAARELLDGAVEPDGKPELGEHGRRARLEIAAAEREKAVERGRSSARPRRLPRRAPRLRRPAPGLPPRRRSGARAALRPTRPAGTRAPAADSRR